MHYKILMAILTDIKINLRLKTFIRYKSCVEHFQECSCLFSVRRTTLFAKK